MSEFYVGYLPKAPVRLHGFVRHVAVSLALLGALVAVILVEAQAPFPPAAFEFLEERAFEGTIQESPYPTLLVRRPGNTLSRYLLVGVGKTGTAEAAARDGQAVRLRGKLIYRDDRTMIEVVPGTMVPAGTPASPPPIEDLGLATLTGEIVDTKCYTGVMNPGEGKVHRECAARCISGGLPPGFLVRDASRLGTVYLLTDPGGEQLSKQLLSSVAEPVTLAGRVWRSGDTLYLRIEPAQLHTDPKTNWDQLSP